MKKFLIGYIVLLSLTLFANESNKIVVGATPVPHVEILEIVKPILKKDGYELVIKEFNDYSIPNLATQDGDLDANFFQHLPYLKEFNKNKGTDLVQLCGVHLEPMGVYSSTIKSINDLKDGDLIVVPNDPTNESRALDVLEKAGLIKLDNVALKTPFDINYNPKNLEFKEIEAAQIPRTLDEASLVVLNTNYALSANLNPKKDALFLEDNDSPYVNYIVIKRGNENSKKLQALKSAISSQEVKDFITEKYKGSILPAF